MKKKILGKKVFLFIEKLMLTFDFFLYYYNLLF